LRTEQEIDNEESNSQNQLIRVMKHAETGWWDAIKGGLQAGNPAATSPHEFPIYAPAVGMTIGAGLIGGYKATDMVLSRLRDRAAKKEIAQARKEYEDAIFGAGGGSGVKLAGTGGSELSRQLTRFVDAVTAMLPHDKTALSPDDAQRMTGSLAGLYLLLAGGGLTAGAYHGYKAQRRNSDIAAVSRANKERQLADNRPVTLLPTVISPPS